MEAVFQNAVYVNGYAGVGSYGGSVLMDIGNVLELNNGYIYEPKLSYHENMRRVRDKVGFLCGKQNLIAQKN